MSTSSILSILVYPQSGYLLVYHMGLSLVHCSYLSIRSLHPNSYLQSCFKNTRQTTTPTSEAIWPEASLALISGQFGFIIIVIMNYGFPFDRQSAKGSVTPDTAQALEPWNEAGRTTPQLELDSACEEICACSAFICWKSSTWFICCCKAGRIYANSSSSTRESISTKYSPVNHPNFRNLLSVVKRSLYHLIWLIRASGNEPNVPTRKNIRYCKRSEKGETISISFCVKLPLYWIKIFPGCGWWRLFPWMRAAMSTPGVVAHNSRVNDFVEGNSIKCRSFKMKGFLFPSSWRNILTSPGWILCWAPFLSWPCLSYRNHFKDWLPSVTLCN